ncbi:MAG: hypothetical protein IJF17_08140 [Thermoguttaceae bacterium]|nr:hypothetical protein [Thermoguttaceae bacterium]
MTNRKMNFIAAGIAAVSIMTGGILVSQTFSSAGAAPSAGAPQSAAAARKPVSEAHSAEREAAVWELTEMFREGLTLAQDPQNAGAEKGGAMIEAALAQGAEFPEAYAAFWAIYRPFLEKSSTSDEVKLAMLEAFALPFEDTSLKCRTRAEFERFWNVQQEVDLCLAELEKKLTDDAETDSVENAEIEEIEEIAGTETNDTLAEIQAGLRELENEWLTLRDEIEKENWDEFNQQFSDRDWKSTEPFAKGKTYLFMEKIQKFAQTQLETDEFALLMESDPDTVFQIRQQVQELLEKGRILNQARYNLWASFVVTNTPENVSGIDHLRWIAPEHLLPALSPFYQEKLEKCLRESREPVALSGNIQMMALTEKVPLSAF